MTMPRLFSSHWFAVAFAGAMFLAAMSVPARAQSVSDDLNEGDGYFEEGNYRKAAQRYDSAIEKWPGQVPAEAYGKRAAIYIIQKEYQAGLDFITGRAQAQHPDAP